MVFSWVPQPGSTHDTAMNKRGADPLLRVQGTAADLLKIVPLRYIKKDLSDDSIETIPYSVAALLLLPGLGVGSEVLNEKVTHWLLKPKTLLVAWEDRVKSGIDTTERRELDELHQESISWAKGRPPTVTLVKANCEAVHAPGKGDLKEDADDFKIEASVAWLRDLTFGMLRASGTAIMLEAPKIMYILKGWNTQASRSEDGDLWAVASLMQSLHTAASSGEATLPARFRIARLLSKWVSPMVPKIFQALELYDNVDSTVTTLLTINDYPGMTANAKNLAMVEALPRVLSKYAGLQKFIGAERGTAVLEALTVMAKRRCEHHFNDTLSEDLLKELNNECSDMEARFDSQKATTMSAKLKIALSDAVTSTEEHRTEAAAKGGDEELVGTSALQKSKLFQDAIETIRKPLDEQTVDITEVMLAAFQSKCMAVMKHMSGKGDHSKLDPVLKQAANYRNGECKVADMQTIADTIAAVTMPTYKNSKGVKVVSPKLETYSPTCTFAMDIIEGRWDTANFAAELVHKPMSLLLGRAIPKGLTADNWWRETGETSLTDFYEEITYAMSALFTEFLPYAKKLCNGIEATLKKAREAVRQAKASAMFGEDIMDNLQGFMQEALRDAGQAWSRAWKSKQADMLMPAEFVPSTSKAAVLLNRTLAQATRWQEDEQASPKFTQAITAIMQHSATGDTPHTQMNACKKRGIGGQHEGARRHWW